MSIKQFYSSSFAPNPVRVNYMLKLKGIECDFIDIDIRKGEQATPQFKAVNPDGTIPVMVLEDDTIFTDVISMLHYIEQTYPQVPLMGNGAIEQAKILGMMHRIYTTGSLAIAEVLRNGAIPGFEGRALPGDTPIEQIPQLMARGNIRLDSFYKSMNAFLENRTYLVGDSVSQADVDFFVCCNFAGFIDRKFTPQEQPNIAAHYELMNKTING